MELPKTKEELAARRSQLIDRIQGQGLSVKERMEAQLELTAINAQIKHLNKVAAAEAKRDADLRKALGRKEAEANANAHAARVAGVGGAGLNMEPGPQDRGDEDILIQAKRLHKHLSRYQEPKPFHFGNLIIELSNFIDVQKHRVKGLARRDEPDHEPGEGKPEDSWREVWTDGQQRAAK